MKLDYIISKLDTIAPLNHAEKWDNVGLLLEPKKNQKIKKILLTIDTTPLVIEEAIKNKVNLIISYHPILFNPINSLIISNNSDKKIISLIHNNISVYSPHTALDNAIGGVNDWLIKSCGPGKITPVSPSEGQSLASARKITLNKPISLNTLCKRIKSYLDIPYLRVASGSADKITTVACCAGSGSSALKDVYSDCYLTGEMSHHNILMAQSNGINVLLSEHSHTERGFLKHYSSMINELLEGSVVIIISKQDRDPITLK